MKKNTVFLWGFMGSGKTSLGERLSEELNFHFVDLDAFISERESCSISDIFEVHGESYFRELEGICIKELSAATDPMVIACGGGTPCFNDLAQYMLDKGLCLYIKCTNQTLIRRLKGAREKRPLIKDFSTDEMSLWMDDLLLNRNEIYRLAHFIIENNNGEDIAVKEMKNVILNS